MQKLVLSRGNFMLEALKINGHVLVVMAPMGSGKGTLIKRALEKFPDLQTTISCTTRQKRPGEKEGRDYYFLSENEFEEKVKQDEFLEWAFFGKNRYGTLKNEIIPCLEKNKIVIVEIEVQGVEQLAKILPQDKFTVAYIEAGGWDNLKKRALARAPMTESELNARYDRYLIEITSKKLADKIIDNSSSDISLAEDEFFKLIEEIKTLLK